MSSETDKPPFNPIYSPEKPLVTENSQTNSMTKVDVGNYATSPFYQNRLLNLSVIILVILAFSSTLALYFNKKPRNNSNQIYVSEASPTPSSHIITSPPPSSSLIPIYLGDYDLETKSCAVNDHHCSAQLFLKNNLTGQEKYVFTVDNVVNDSRTPEYHNGYFFLIKRVGNDNYPSNDWTDELWVYTDQNNNQKLYSLKGLTFGASSDGSFVAIPDAENDMDRAIILSRATKWQPVTVNIDFNQCHVSSSSSISNPEITTWQNQPLTLWGEFSGEYGFVGCYWQVDPTTLAVKYYPTDYQMFFAFNPDKLVALYTDHPAFVDEDSANSWLSSHPTYSLYIYSITNRSSIKIATFPSKFGPDVYSLGPKWISSTQLQYSTPTGQVTYTLK